MFPMQFLVEGLQTSSYIIKAFLQIYIMLSFDMIVYDFVLNFDDNSVTKNMYESSKNSVLFTRFERH